MVFLTVMFCVIVASNWKCNGLSELCLIGRILLLILLMQTIGKSQLAQFFEFLDYTWGPHTVDCFCHFL